MGGSLVPLGGAHPTNSRIRYSLLALRYSLVGGAHPTNSRIRYSLLALRYSLVGGAQWH